MASVDSRVARRTTQALNPATRPLTGNNLGNQPLAGGPGSPPKREAQGIPKKIAAFTGAGGGGAKPPSAQG